MAQSLAAFSKSIVLTASQIQPNADALTRKCALAVDQTVVLATPVDTGRARSNWIVTTDTPASNEIPAYVPGKGQSTGAANAQAAINQGQTEIAKFKGEVNGAICITNNLDYIEGLNDGHSAQAPANFVEQAVSAGIRAIAGADIIATDRNGNTL